ncbi:MAG: cytosine permease [Chloroflexi bacterium]|nr:cytosine permease [Chloroflexota bacterium]
MSEMGETWGSTETESVYREHMLTVEPHGIEPISAAARHGRTRSLFSLWLSANMGLPVWLVGALAVVLGLGFADGVAAIVIGNMIGCGLLALTASMGPAIGLPQLPFTRRSFGARGVYLPALLNWISTSGWYAVNTVLGTFALARLTSLPFWVALLLLSAGQMLLGVYGYNVIHRFEAVSAVLLAVIFVVMTVIGVPQAHFGRASRLALADHVGLFVLMTTAVASYAFSWAPYAADYARYLPAATPKRRVFMAVFGGAFLGCVWLQVLGAAVATIGLTLTPIDLVIHVMGGFWVPALLAVVLGTLAANALNIYTGSLALLTLDVPLTRGVSVLAVGVLGGLLALYGSTGYSAKYEQFLLLISYWIGPWVAIVVLDFFLGRARDDGRDTVIVWPGLLSFLTGLAVSIPFMNSALYEGPLAHLLHGADIAYYVGIVVAGGLYYVVQRLKRRHTLRIG